MENTTETGDLNQIIAANLKGLRKARGMTLDDLAAASGVSKSMLGQVERGDCGLSVTTLWKIANGLKISFTSLMKETHPAAKIVNNRAVPPRANGQTGVWLYPIFPFENGRDFEILDLELDSGTESALESHEPGTETFTMVYHGTLSLTVGRGHYEIGAGHSIRFDSDQPHGYANHTGELVRCYLVTRYAQSI